MSSKLFWIALQIAFLAISSVSARADGWLDHLFTNGHTIRGSGTMVTEDRDVAPFTRIEVAMGVDVEVTVGKPQSVKITFDDNIIERVRTRVRGRTLEIDSKGSISTHSDCRIEITVPELSGFALSGSGDIEIRNVSGDEFEIAISGSGDVYVDGKATQLSVDVSGSGSVDARELLAKEASVAVAGSGDVKVYAESKLEASIAGSGDVTYFGNPEHVDSDVAGSGSIHRGRSKT